MRGEPREGLRLRELINHGDDARQNRSSHPQAAAFNLRAAKRAFRSSALDDDFDIRSAGYVIHGANVNEPDAAKETMRDKPAFYFMPNLDEPGVEFLSILIVFHRQPDYADSSARVAAKSLRVGYSELLTQSL